MVAVLDAWALIAVLQFEPAGPRVETAIAELDTRISWINLGEVLYEMIRRVGPAEAEQSLRRVLDSVRAEEPDRALVMDAARLKARGGISYADCFAVATAKRHDAPLLTGDPEIVALAGEVEVVDLRVGP